MRRRWLPWHVRRRSLAAGPDVVGILLFALSFAVLAIEFLLALLLMLFALTGRVVARRPWPIDATTAGPPPRRLTWLAKGFGASGDRVRMAARAIEQGDDPSADADRQWIGTAQASGSRSRASAS